MKLSDIAFLKSLRCSCAKCIFFKRCSKQMTKACIDSYVKGFMAGYKYKGEIIKGKKK